MREKSWYNVALLKELLIIMSIVSDFRKLLDYSVKDIIMRDNFAVSRAKKHGFHYDSNLYVYVFARCEMGFHLLYGYFNLVYFQGI